MTHDTEETAEAAEFQLVAMRAALEKIAAGTEDAEPPYRAVPREVMRRIARDALSTTAPSPDYRALAKAAVPFAQIYARANPKWKDATVPQEQDPGGVHDWLNKARAAGLLAEGE